MFDIYYSVSSRLTSEHAGGFSPHATWPNPLSYQISSSEPSARARVTQLRARSSCAPGAAPGSCAQPPLATRRPRARVVAPRPAQLALVFDASSGSELRRDERLRTEERAEKERADAVVADGADGGSTRPPVSAPPILRYGAVVHRSTLIAMCADMHAIPDSMLQRSYAPSVRAAVSRSDTALCAAALCRSCATQLRRHLVQACSRAAFALSALCLAACPCAVVEFAILQR